MIDKSFKYLSDNLPVWMIVMIIFIAGIMKYGPKFMKEVISVGEDYRNKSDHVKNEYIALLKYDKEKLEHEKEKLKQEIEILKMKYEN